jgi:hypothetical protein
MVACQLMSHSRRLEEMGLLRSDEFPQVLLAHGAAAWNPAAGEVVVFTRDYYKVKPPAAQAPDAPMRLHP